MQRQKLNNIIFAIVVAAILAVTIWRVLPENEKTTTVEPMQTQTQAEPDDATIELIKKGSLSDKPARDWQRIGQ